MSTARNYWVATVLPAGRPHLTPVWGLWVEKIFYSQFMDERGGLRATAQRPPLFWRPGSVKERAKPKEEQQQEEMIPTSAAFGYYPDFLIIGTELTDQGDLYRAACAAMQLL